VALGLAGFFVGKARCEKAVREHEALLVETDRLLEAEDRAAQAAAAGVSVPGDSVEPSAP